MKAIPLRRILRETRAFLCVSLLTGLIVGQSSRLEAATAPALKSAAIDSGVLPKAWNWCTGTNPAGPNPTWQTAQIDAGAPIIPTFEWTNPRATWAGMQGYAEQGLLAAASRNAPIILRYNNVFDSFRLGAQWNVIPLSTDPAQSPYFLKTVNGVTTGTTRVVSPWSNFLKYDYDLGMMMATSEYTKGLAARYPNPPRIYCMDNNETGFLKSVSDVLADVRCPPRLKALQAARDSVALTSPTPVQGNPTGQPDTWQGLDAALTDAATNGAKAGYARHYAEFERGFEDGLRTHAPGWVGKVQWVGYATQGVDVGTSEVHGIDNGLQNYSQEFAWGGGGDRFSGGRTGQLYNQSWYGGFSTMRTVIQGDASRYAFEAKQAAGLLPNRTVLLWEGSVNKPTASQWRGLVRYWLWVTQATLVGHFASSQSTTSGDAIAIYYQGIIDSCREIADVPELADFWKNAQLEPSTDLTPNQYSDTLHPAYFNDPRRHFLLHVLENRRFDSANNDLWHLDRTRRLPVHILALSFLHVDGRRMIYVAGLDQAYSTATITIPNGAIMTLAAPLGGAFYELNTDGTVFDILKNAAVLEVKSGAAMVAEGSGIVHFTSSTAGESGSEAPIEVQTAGKMAFTVNSVTLPTGFLLDPQPTALNSLSTAFNFNIRVDASQPGTFDGVVRIWHSLGEPNPFTFNVSATVMAAGTRAVAAADRWIDYR